MKKLILFLIVFTINAKAQEIATTESGKRVQLNKNGTYKVLPQEKKIDGKINQSDFINQGEDIVYKNEFINILNGDENYVKCKFSYRGSLNRFSTVGIDLFNTMLSTSNVKTMFKMKNRRTYIPKKISLFFVEEKNYWLCSVDYTAQNDYGGLKDGTSYTTFNELGEFQSIIIP